MTHARRYIVTLGATDQDPCAVASVATDQDAEYREVPPGADPVTTVQAIAAVLREMGYQGQPVLCVVDSRACMSATLNPASGSSRQELLYSLEEVMPVPAEELTGDFAAHDGPGPVLGVAVETARFQPWVHALETHGVPVQSLLPAAILTAMGLGDEAAECDGLLWAEGEWVEYVTLSQGRPTGWFRIPGDPDLWSQYWSLNAAAFSEPRRLRVGPLPSTLLQQLADHSSPPAIEQAPSNPRQIAARVAAQLLEGRRSPWIELRRDGLAPSDPHRALRQPFTWAWAATVLFLISLTGSMLTRGQQLQDATQRRMEQARQLFTQALPRQQDPGTLGGIHARLLSEYRKAQALRGVSGPSPQTLSATATLHEVLIALPSGLRYRVQELRIEPERLHLVGEARSHADADAIASALRQGGKLDVEPPRTQALAERGVSFELSARITRPSTPPPAGERASR